MPQLLPSYFLSIQRLPTSRSIAVPDADLDVAVYATSNYFRKSERLDDSAPKRICTKQIDFQSFTLENVEQVNHNVTTTAKS